MKHRRENNIEMETMRHIAEGTKDPAEYVVVIATLGFHIPIYGQRATMAWNRAHPDIALPVPSREA